MNFGKGQEKGNQKFISFEIADFQKQETFQTHRAENVSLVVLCWFFLMSFLSKGRGVTKKRI